MKKTENILFLLLFTMLISAGSSMASSSAPTPFSTHEVKFLQNQEMSVAPGAMETSPTPMTANEADFMAGMEAASGIDADMVTAGSSLIDLLIIVVIVYLILRILD
ncbi:MAG: hypothetical protein OEZ04_00880 [Nitrospinota bacterium]|nr:hypothetical protein [Nitrospinota bacterium]